MYCAGSRDQGVEGSRGRGEKEDGRKGSREQKTYSSSLFLRLFPLPLSFFLLLIVLTGCGARSGDRAGQIQVRGDVQEIELKAVFRRANAEKGTWHLLVQSDGSMASLAYFTTDVTPLHFYEQLRAVGFEDRNSITCETMGDANAAASGDTLEYFFEWEGAPKRISLEELLVETLPEATEAARRGLEMRFGGNHTGADAADPPSHDSGCLACLYTCCAGVTSNSRANLVLLRSENDRHRYRLRPGVDLADGTPVRIIVRRRTASAK